jgi:hypothetical protein
MMVMMLQSKHDHSQKTIEELMKYGYRDPELNQLMKDRLVQLVKKSDNGKTGEGNHRIEKLQKSFHQIQENIKIEDGYHAITSEVENVIEEVGSMQEKNDHGLSLEKEKVLLIEAARQFQSTAERSKIDPIPSSICSINKS